jgi:hypothetical protein
MGEIINAYKILVGNPDDSADLLVGGRIILE